MLSIRHPSVVRWVSLPYHRSSRFTYVPDTKTLVAEASDFKGQRLTGRVFTDAIDEGFIIKSDRSGSEIVFCLDAVEYDTGGEITGWRYRPLRDQAAAVEGVSVLIIND